MNNIFIKNIKINKVRHLKDIEILIEDVNRKHLIITGKNGSGKTSLLNSILANLVAIQNNELFQVPNWKQNIQHWHNSIKNHRQELQGSGKEQDRVRLRNEINNLEMKINQFEQKIDYLSDIELGIYNYEFLQTEYNKGNFIISFFDAKRSTQLQTPNGIQKIKLKEVYQIQEKANHQFIQYLVNLKAQRSFARDAGKMETVEAIDNWFIIFEDYLREIFEDKKLILDFDSENFNFNIIQSNKENFNLNTLSDGYSAIMNIITELIMRMEKRSSKTYELQGIVFIDEVETHLHIELQKLILPFLIKVFPKIQFIVTTHSPFIINSVSNVSIYDLENKTSVTDLSGFSVEGIIEAYFKSDKYSILLKQYVNEYEMLFSLKAPKESESERIKELKNYFKNLSKFLAPELELKIQQIELSKIR